MSQVTIGFWIRKKAWFGNVMSHTGNLGVGILSFSNFDVKNVSM
jgi:hypothetical protein